MGDDYVRRLTNSAVFVADSIGLCHPGLASDSDKEERDGVLWCLSNITSAVHVTPRHYSHFPVTGNERLCGTENKTQRHRCAKYGLACIADRIRTELSSSDEPPAIEFTTALNTQIQKFREGQFAPDITCDQPRTYTSRESENLWKDPLPIDHQVSLLSTRMLLYWPRTRFSTQDRLYVVHNARKVITLLLGLWKARATTAACYTALTR